jgi:hypothetical protein
VTDELVGRLFKDGGDVTHRVVRSTDNRSVGGSDVEMACGLQCNVIPRISLRKHGDVDCMGCLVKVR